MSTKIEEHQVDWSKHRVEIGEDAYRFRVRHRRDDKNHIVSTMVTLSKIYPKDSINVDPKWDKVGVGFALCLPRERKKFSRQEGDLTAIRRAYRALLKINIITGLMFSFVLENKDQLKNLKYAFYNEYCPQLTCGNFNRHVCAVFSKTFGKNGFENLSELMRQKVMAVSMGCSVENKGCPICEESHA